MKCCNENCDQGRRCPYSRHASKPFNDYLLGLALGALLILFSIEMGWV
jgi:hypothetical protein